MLYKKYSLNFSPISGLGLFCAENKISKGEIVYKCNDQFLQIISLDDIKNMPDCMKHMSSMYCYPGGGQYKLENALYFCTDDSRFMNHSETPSLTWVDKDGGYYIASRDLLKGDEFTCDYGDFCEKGTYCYSFAKP